LESDNNQELKKFVRKPLIGHNNSESSALIDFSDIVTDVFNSIPFMKENVYIMSKMASGITGKRKFIPKLIKFDLSLELGIVIHGADPLIKINLIGIACAECAKITTIDLFREYNTETAKWYCPCCGEPYDNLLIEMAIISWVNTHLASVYS
jgi:hypothetical protein